jgi:hypothetical protein
MVVRPLPMANPHPSDKLNAIKLFKRFPLSPSDSRPR